MEAFVLFLARMAWFFFSVWILMLSLGAAHSYYEGVPALGYQATLWVSVAFTWLLSPTVFSLLLED